MKEYKWPYENEIGEVQTDEAEVLVLGLSLIHISWVVTAAHSNSYPSASPLLMAKPISTVQESQRRCGQLIMTAFWNPWQMRQNLSQTILRGTSFISM